MPWEKRFRDADVLDGAMRAFWAKGYSATSVADLVAATGINRGSIYASFTDKRGLFLRALGHYDTRFRAAFLDRIARENPPRAAIHAAFEAAARPPETDPPGCLLVNTALELAPHDAEVGAFVAACLAEVEAFFRDRIKAARAEGTLRKGIRPRATARALLALFLGLRVLARGGASPGSLRAVVVQADNLLE